MTKLAMKMRHLCSVGRVDAFLGLFTRAKNEELSPLGYDKLFYTLWSIREFIKFENSRNIVSCKKNNC